MGSKDLKEFSEDPITALLFLHWKCQRAQWHTKAHSLTSPALPWQARHLKQLFWAPDEVLCGTAYCTDSISCLLWVLLQWRREMTII